MMVLSTELVDASHVEEPAEDEAAMVVGQITFAHVLLNTFTTHSLPFGLAEGECIAGEQCLVELCDADGIQRNVVHADLGLRK